MSGQMFPGTWSLARVSAFIVREPARVKVSYSRIVGPVVSDAKVKQAAERTVTLIPRQWTPVMVDLSPFSDPNATPRQQSRHAWIYASSLAGRSGLVRRCNSAG